MTGNIKLEALFVHWAANEELCRALCCDADLDSNIRGSLINLVDTVQ